MDFVKTVLQFNKLQRVDIGGAAASHIFQGEHRARRSGGTKGKVLSASVRKVPGRGVDGVSVSVRLSGA